MPRPGVVHVLYILKNHGENKKYWHKMLLFTFEDTYTIEDIKFVSLWRCRCTEKDRNHLRHHY
jgi:hypothetical protein